jgi:hypothetical protein
MAQLSNTDKWVYLDKTPTGETRAYVRLGAGVTSFVPANNPSVDTKHYINAANPTTKVTGFSKQFNVTMERYKSDDANDFIAGLAGKIGTDAATTIIVVEHHDSAAVTTKPAKLYNVTIVVNGEGAIVGGGAMDMDVAIYANGDPISGTFNETSAAWTAT